jgi:hypothetical protein
MAALAAKNAKGAKLGNSRNIVNAGANGRTVQVAAAAQFVAGLLPLVMTIRGTGAHTLEAFSCALNDRGIHSARGTRRHGSSVANLIASTSAQ